MPAFTRNNQLGRVLWIDIAKAIAIIGVIINHTTDILYTDGKICSSSYYAVSLFILLAGTTKYMTLKK